MSGEPQLERSVLEGKERDKLQAIADALGLKTSARAKKTDLIDGILRATGVEVAPAADAEAAKPKRSPRRRVTEVAPEPNGSGDQGVLGAVAEVGESQEPTAEASAPPSEPESQPSAGAQAGGEPAPGPADDGPAEPAPADPQTRQEPPRSYPQPTGPPGPGNAANPAVAASSGNQSGANQPGSNNQPQHQGQPGQAPPTEGGDVRRNRRRRGRDRDRMGAGYDQQAQQADQAFTGDPLPCDGLLELRPEGFGFLRTSGYLTGPDDVYVSTSQVRRFSLRAGDRIVGASRPPTTQERFGALLRIDAVGDQSPDDARRRPRFEDLTPVFPNERLTLELGEQNGPASTTARIIDLLSPIGKGQRALVVSPPRAGKTTVLQHIATAIEANHPDVDLMVLLVDERPEEVTEMRRRVKGEVIGSTIDRPADDHTHAAELAIAVAKRRVEAGRDVVVILDGITRLARAHNLSASAGGRVVSDGAEATALYAAKKLLAAARNVEEGGSLTILATALVETGSATDTAIFEELRDSANLELRLDGRLAQRRLYPAIDVTASATRHEELLLPEEDLARVWELRRALVASGPELLLDKLRSTRTNAELLAGLSSAPA